MLDYTIDTAQCELRIQWEVYSGVQCIITRFYISELKTNDILFSSQFGQ